MKRLLKGTVVLFIVFFCIGIFTRFFIIDYNVFQYGEFEEIKFLDYFTNNIKVACSLMLGFFSLGITTFIIFSINAIFFGVGIAAQISESGIIDSLFYIFPHGLFEIPALIISACIGFYPIYFILQIIKKESSLMIVKEELIKMVFLILVVILLVTIAAMLEATMTPYLIKMVIGG
ncbi:hypothetical protein, transmembrane DUF95 [Carnobacterium sp. 17-4]|uniref:stage II sporulation protein M n=1 Tax=Carnobacterium sp. (strain 17-4) TaxID=208596 RepID=UPI00020588D4|nr:stage II sporulation protein M [Carnobacterium sp. 17-4]AEB28837.1 hypothetical protein, transmembrane DUF95 [Carnobacterium sp. 17-4]